MYVVVFHGRGRIGFAEVPDNKAAEYLVVKSAELGLFTLAPLPGHAMTALSDSGTYFLPFERADEIVIVEDLQSLHVNLD